MHVLQKLSEQFLLRTPPVFLYVFYLLASRDSSKRLENSFSRKLNTNIISKKISRRRNDNNGKGFENNKLKFSTKFKV